ncbi:hypothetical protein ACFCWT_18775 [Streptomyces olivaceus]|uniref:hypothetical protein n=1 Tax=Streptomyces olivaceus TaxID=47716 RepID=UPI0035DED7DA
MSESTQTGQDTSDWPIDSPDRPLTQAYTDGHVHGLPVAAPENVAGILGANPPTSAPGTAAEAFPGRRYDQRNYGPGPSYQGDHVVVHNNWNDEYVRELLVPDADFAASTEARYVPPRDIDRLKEAEHYLARYGVVVLSAPPGSGRRTTALHLLATAALEPSVPPLHLRDLEPEWSEVRIGQLPKVSGHGYLLDLTDLPAEEPSERLRSLLSDYGRDGVRKGWRLVILASPQSWRGRWREAAAEFTVSLPAPDARILAKRELTVRDAADRAVWLDDEVFTEIWTANPPAQEACRLAGIILRVQHTYGLSPDRRLLERAKDEFQGWHVHIDHLLNQASRGQGQPSLLANRATVWAGALLHGGEPRSVLKAADALMDTLAIPRQPADILGDATSSQRLHAANLKAKGGRVFHDEDKHGLAPAILDNLWEEFPTQRTLFNTWAVSTAANSDIPEEDARLITRRLLHLATTRHDGAVLEAMATGLDSTRRQLATEALTEAALDPDIGAYVRQRLYAWSRKASSPQTLRLVIAVCGGELGRKEPGIALTRLRWATARSPLGAPSAVRAFKALITEHPSAVEDATKAWFAKSTLDDVLPVFFAIASSDEGAVLLLKQVRTDVDRDRFVRAWQQLLLREDTRDVVDRQLTRWGELADQKALPREELVDLLADVYEPEVQRGGLNRFYDDSPGFLESFWGHVLGEAIQRRRHRRDQTQAQRP